MSVENDSWNLLISSHKVPNCLGALVLLWLFTLGWLPSIFTSIRGSKDRKCDIVGGWWIKVRSWPCWDALWQFHLITLQTKRSPFSSDSGSKLAMYARSKHQFKFSHSSKKFFSQQECFLYHIIAAINLYLKGYLCFFVFLFPFCFLVGIFFSFYKKVKNHTVFPFLKYSLPRFIIQYFLLFLP